MAHTAEQPYSDVVERVGSTYAFSSIAFITYFPEFKNIDPTIMEATGLLSVSMLRESTFGKMFPTAVALYTAHRLATRYDMGDAYDTEGLSNQSSTGEGTSVSASTSSLSESVQPNSLTSSDDPFTNDLAQTKYGLQLLALMKAWISPGDMSYGMPIELLAPRVHI